MLELREWDEDYVQSEIAKPGEHRQVKKKAAAAFGTNRSGKVNGDTLEEIAKQISAFANASHGFLVFGIANDGQPDAGVPIAIGRQPTNEWVEAIAPNLVTPPLHGCEARLIRMNHHDPDHALLVISIPLSDGRPHWTDNDAAYIRTGAHSSPMPRSTFLDMASRGSSSAVEIVSLEGRDSNAPSRAVSIHIKSTIRLLRGAICREWAFDLFLEGASIADFAFSQSYFERGIMLERHHAYYVGKEPLFPGRETIGAAQCGDHCPER